jgi:hypothetical protein
VTRAAAKVDPPEAPPVRPAPLTAEALERRRIPVLRAEWSITTLHARETSGELDLRRPFQPEAVWTPSARARLVESVLLRLPLLPIHVAEDRDGVMHIIDGLQRLSALFDFLRGKLILTGLTLLPELDGLRFSDLSIRLRRRFEDTALTIVILQADAAPELTAEIFDRLNAGMPRGAREPAKGG